MLWQPWRVAILGVFAWVIIWLLAPIQGITRISGTATAYIAFCYAGFMAGCVMWEIARNGQQPDEAETQASFARFNGTGKIFWITFAVGLFGVASRFYDRTIVRGASLELEIAEAREMLQSEASSIFGTIGGFLSPFAYIPLLLLIMATGKQQNRPKLIAALLLYVLPVIDASRQGSRSVMLIAVMLAIFTFALSRLNGKLLTPRFAATGVAISIVFAIASTAIFSARLNSFQRDLSDASFNSVFAQSIGPNHEAKLGLYARENLERGFYRVVVPNSLYYTSGVYEFSRLWHRPDGQNHTYGTEFIYPYTRVVTQLLGVSDLPEFLQPDEWSYYRPGVFTSLFGPIWVEWGYFGPFTMLLFGVIVTAISHKVRRGSLNLMPLYVLFLLILFYAPVANFLVIGHGFFCFNAFIAFAIFERLGASDRRGNHRFDEPIAASLPPAGFRPLNH
ncbi:MAG: hypothetical protein KDE55_13615 [Novosphingobium sp.]|nr:hypothetical protein [Novosphingobium sp.]